MADTKLSHYTPRRIEKIKFEKFKNLDGLEIDFTGHNVTCLFGCNGVGKSTILSVLRCVFQPTDRRNAKAKKLPSVYNEKKQLDIQNENFSAFCFNPQERWNDTSIVVDFTEWKDASKSSKYIYSKKEGKRWKPEMRQRPCKQVYYMGLESCVPIMEQDWSQKSRKKRMKYYASILNNNKEIAEAMSAILGKTFADLESAEVDTNNNPKDLALIKEGDKFRMIDLSAGEQRLLRILQMLYKAKDFSLILIDEIELALHPIALCHLVSVITQIAEYKNLQVVFTSHRAQLLRMSNEMNIRSLYKYDGKILCENGVVPISLEQVYGRDYQQKPTIFCEDKLSMAILRQILDELNQRKKFHIQPFGSYEKGFMVATAIQSIGQLNNNMVFVLDGDVCLTDEEKRKEAQKWHTADSHDTGNNINEVVEYFTQYTLPTGCNIEKFIYDVLVSDNSSNDRICIAARNISPTPIIPPEITDHKQKKYMEKHYYIAAITDDLGYEEQEALTKIVSVFASYRHEWESFVKEVKERIEAIP